MENPKKNGLKVSIKIPELRIIPSKRLLDFIATLDSEPCMPINIIRIYEKQNKTSATKKAIFTDPIPNPSFTKRETEILQELDKIKTEKNPINHSQTSPLSSPSKVIDPVISTFDLKWLHQILVERRKIGESDLYLHELIANCQVLLPENEILERNPVLEARCQRLKKEQAAREYRAMTKEVDSTRRDAPEDTIGYQLKQINRQLIAVAQFIFSVAAGFAFGFIGIALIVGELDFGFRLLLGIMIALIIALAEIYFLAKKLNEYDEVEKMPSQTAPPAAATTAKEKKMN